MRKVVHGHFVIMLYIDMVHTVGNLLENENSPVDDVLLEAVIGSHIPGDMIGQDEHVASSVDRVENYLVNVATSPIPGPSRAITVPSPSRVPFIDTREIPFSPVYRLQKQYDMADVPENLVSVFESGNPQDILDATINIANRHVSNLKLLVLAKYYL